MQVYCINLRYCQVSHVLVFTPPRGAPAGRCQPLVTGSRQRRCRFRAVRRCRHRQCAAPALPQPVRHGRHQDGCLADGLAAKRARADQRPAARRGRDDTGRCAGPGQRHREAKPAGRPVGQLRHARLHGRPEFRFRLHGQRFQFQPGLQRHARRRQYAERGSAERPRFGPVRPGRAGRHRQYHDEKAEVRARIQRRCVPRQLPDAPRRAGLDGALERQLRLPPERGA